MGYPTYQPLPSGVPAPLGVFTTPAIAPDAFVQEDQKIALERAQELANQTSAFALQQKQQEEADKKQMEDALKSQYGNMDPNAPVDPKQALDTAYRIAASQGNLDQMLKLGQQKLLVGANGVDNLPLTADEQKYFADSGLPVPATRGEAKLILSTQNSQTMKQKVDQIQGRHLDNFGLKKGLTEATGYLDALPGANGTAKPLTPDQIKQGGGISSALETILHNSDSIIQDLTDNRYPIGDAAVKQEQALYGMMPAIRQLDSQGVRFNEFIKGIDIGQFGDDPTGNSMLAHRIAQTFTGQDPAAAIQRFANEIARQSVSQLYEKAGSRINPSKLSTYRADVVPLFAKYGVFDAGQDPNVDPRNPLAVAGGLAGGQQPPSKYGAGGPPLQPNGQPLTPEQFQQYLAQQQQGG